MKNIEDYKYIKSDSLTILVKRLNKEGKYNFKNGSFIPYIVCLDIYNNHKDYEIINIINENNIKYYHPNEIKKDKELKIDYEWYKKNQILPIIKELVKNIKEINIDQLYKCLNVINEANQINGEEEKEENNNKIFEKNNNYINLIKKQKIYNLIVKNGIIFKCPFCCQYIKINKLITREECIKKIIKCEKCNNFLNNNNFDIISNIIKTTSKLLIFYYFRTKSVCPLCKDTNSLFCRKICPDKFCKGNLEIEYDESNIYKELQFLNILVNEIEYSDDIIVNEFNENMLKIKKYFNKLYEKIKFNEINIKNIFKFINKKY